jgi:RHS repeat-associated protein
MEDAAKNHPENNEAFIHMNGRIYDPRLGRMLSPDPVTQAPENGQNYNRYTYANNNPLKYSDPSGFSYVDCAVAYESGGSNMRANAGCANTIYNVGKSISKAFREFGILGGNGCDGVCNHRKAAMEWCRTSAPCFAYAQTVREQWRKKSIIPLYEAHLFSNTLASAEGDQIKIGDPQVITPIAGTDGMSLPLLFYNSVFSNVALTEIANARREALSQRRIVGIAIRNDGNGNYNNGEHPNNFPSSLLFNVAQLDSDGLSRIALDPEGLSAAIFALPKFGTNSSHSKYEVFYFEFANTFEVPVIVSETRKRGGNWIYLPGEDEAIQWF